MATTRFSFGDFELDPAGYGLFQRGTAVQVEPRVLELLVYLVRHRERVVTKDELLQQLWPQKYVTESVLTRAIYEARRAIEDDSRRQGMIKTVHSRGYQFVAAVDEIVLAESIAEASSEEPPPEDPPRASAHALPDAVSTAPSSPPRHRRVLGIAILSLFAVSILASGIWWWQSAHPAPRERVAIAPFGIDDGEQDLSWGELALPRLVADVLHERTDVVVFPANRVRQSLRQRGLASDAPEQDQVRALRDLFGVDHVLFGRMGRENGRVHVDFHLVTIDGKERRGRASGDGPGSLTTQLAESVAHELDVAYEAGIPLRKIAASEFTNEAFARGLNALLGGQLADALRFFETCLASEPDNGWARYESGNVLSLLGHWDDAAAAFEKARSDAESSDDHNLAGAAASGLGTLAWRRGRLDEAEKYFEIARTDFTIVNRRANLASALGNLGILADNRGQLQLARERYELALTLYRDEGERAGESASYSNLAVVERKLGKLDAAAQMQQRAIELQRRIGLREMLVFSLTHLGEIDRGRGRWDLAEPSLNEAVTLARETGYRVGEAEALTMRGALAFDLGRRGAAESDLRAARAIYAGLDNPSGDIRSALLLSRLLGANSVDEARQLATHAATVAQRIGDESQAIEAELVMVDLGIGNLGRLLPRLQTHGDHRLLALSWAGRARREGNVTLMQTALDHAESAHDQRLQAELSVALARMYLVGGSLDRIGALLGRAEVWKADYLPAQETRACHLAQIGREADARRIINSTDGADMSWCPHWK